MDSESRCGGGGRGEEAVRVGGAGGGGGGGGGDCDRDSTGHAGGLGDEGRKNEKTKASFAWNLDLGGYAEEGKDTEGGGGGVSRSGGGGQSGGGEGGGEEERGETCVEDPLGENVVRDYICLFSCCYTYVCPHTAMYVSSYCYICVLILLYMCPHTAVYMSSYCYICPHTAIYLSSYCCTYAVYMHPAGERLAAVS